MMHIAGTNVTPGATLEVIRPPQPHIEPTSLLPADLIRLLITAKPDCVYAVEGSSNLVDWVSLCTLTNLSKRVWKFAR